MGWIDKDTFNFWVPAQSIVVKGAKDGANKDSKRWIQGIASTGTRDLQGEIVNQHGIDVSYFLKHGYFNNDHKDGFSNKVGEPTECKITKNGLWVKGFLYKDHPVSDDIWTLLNSLQRSGAKRRLGFSIQGKVKRRNGTQIEECWLQDIAVTPAPVNTTTWAEIAKSLSTQKWLMNKSESESEDEEEEEKKAFTASTSPLVPESLDGGIKNTRHLEKSYTFDETVCFIKGQNSGMALDAAEATARVVFNMFGLKGVNYER